MTDPSSSQRLPDVYGGQGLVQPMQAMQAVTVPYPFEEGSARSSTTEWVSHKTMTDESRDRLRAHANEHPKVTRQQVADKFGVSRRTVNRILYPENENKTGKRRQAAGVQLVQRKLAPKVSGAGAVTGVPCPPADRPGNERLLGDLNFASPNGSGSGSSRTGQGRPADATAITVSQPLSRRRQSSNFPLLAPAPGSSPDASIGEQSFPHPASASKDDREASQNTTIPTIPTIKVCAPENSASVTLYDQCGESSAIRSLPPGRLSKRLTATEPAKALHSPQSYPAILVQAQRHAVTPEEAYKAIQVVIGYCQQQPRGFLEQRDGVSLGQLSERLRYSCE